MQREKRARRHGVSASGCVNDVKYVVTAHNKTRLSGKLAIPTDFPPCKHPSNSLPREAPWPYEGNLQMSEITTI